MTEVNDKYRVPRHKPSLPDNMICHALGGPGSLSNERVIGECCGICELNGFPHEPTIWQEIQLHNEYGTIGNVPVAVDYFHPGSRRTYTKPGGRSRWKKKV